MERSEKIWNAPKERKRTQPGNQNAAGHGGTGPPAIKTHATTGEFETLLFDCLEPEEKQLAAAVPNDKEQLLFQEIQLLTVRERRMLKKQIQRTCGRRTLQRFPENPESKREK